MFGELSGMPQPSPSLSAGRDVPSRLSEQRHAGWVVACPPPQPPRRRTLGQSLVPHSFCACVEWQASGGRACATVPPEGQTAPQLSGVECTLGTQDRAGGLWGDWPGWVRLDSGFESGSGSLFWSPDGKGSSDQVRSYRGSREAKPIT